MHCRVSNLKFSVAKARDNLVLELSNHLLLRFRRWIQDLSVFVLHFRLSEKWLLFPAASANSRGWAAKTSERRREAGGKDTVSGTCNRDRCCRH